MPNKRLKKTDERTTTLFNLKNMLEILDPPCTSENYSNSIF